MTDKQIIIDGKQINCPCYIDRPLYRYDKGCLIQSQAFSEQQTNEKPILRCDEIKNCPIKEQYLTIQRKEQEFEELNKTITNLKNIRDEFYTELDQLKAENEEYIKDIEYLKTIIKDFTQEVVKLKQTLTEIKELIKSNCKICKDFESKDCNYCNYKKILTKINEGNNDMEHNEL